MAKFRLPIRKARIGLINLFRKRQRLSPYLLLSLNGAIDELPQPRPRIPFGRFILPPDPPTVSSLRRQFEQLALDPRVHGVVIRIECTASAAAYQSLRQLLLDFRAGGKRLIAYANSFGPFQYYLAAACDQVIMPPGAEWGITGLLREYVFFKDALDQLGIGVDVVNVSPFKSAFDQFKRSDFSDESRAQAEWLLDATYNELVHGIAEGRKLNETRVRELIDGAPVGARTAVELGLLDAVLYEDELETYLAPAAAEVTPPVANEKNPGKAKPAGKGTRKKQHQLRAQLAMYDDARRGLLIPYFERPAKRIGVVMVEGTIVEGRSQSLPLPAPVPFFGNQFAGAESIVQALRQAGEDDSIAAIILYVDSGGGSALASDLIAREVRRVRETKPVVAYMGGVAASGGYYVAALAHSIIAQPLTITGSIGVIAMKPNVQAAQGKLFLHNTLLQRGAHAGMYSIATPFSTDEHTAIADSIQRIYADFKRVVAEGRKLDAEAIEPIAGGRVWTGAMAHERGLVDELGSFALALDKARALAGLPEALRPSAIVIGPPRKFALPTPKAAAEGLAGVRALWNMFGRARHWALLPWQMPKGD